VKSEFKTFHQAFSLIAWENVTVFLLTYLTAVGYDVHIVSRSTSPSQMRAPLTWPTHLNPAPFPVCINFRLRGACASAWRISGDDDSRKRGASSGVDSNYGHLLTDDRMTHWPLCLSWCSWTSTTGLFVMPQFHGLWFVVGFVTFLSVCNIMGV